ncbi:hypothetical protein LTR36_007076 [Oleoguttula mirabilis]|uniref:Uncharacterized protein n=1 Tax=Oleoguttula mirabilis TaxID=1507867 RepID=A0AAV9JB65_9PEZI|nr:hypothetical protein LTR36_007076 [Oleoguttula mirabilis]
MQALQEEVERLRAEVASMHAAALPRHQDRKTVSEDSASDEVETTEDETSPDEGEPECIESAHLESHVGVGRRDSSHLDSAVNIATRVEKKLPVPTTEASSGLLDANDLWVVISRYDSSEGGGKCEIKGVFDTLEKANKIATAVVKEEFPDCEEAGISNRGVSDDPWAMSQDYSGDDIGVAQMRHAKNGEVRYAVDEENDGNGYRILPRADHTTL